MRIRILRMISRDPRGGLMESTTLEADVSAACEILTDLRHSRDEAKTSASIRQLSQLLYREPQRRPRVFQVAWSRGGVHALLGILRSSQSISLLTDAAGCLALCVQDNSHAAHQLASRDVLSSLLPLICPRSESPRATPGTTRYPLSSSISWHREWLPVYETTLAAIRKLTYHSPALRATFAEMGGIRLIIELSSSPEFISSCSSFSPASRDKLAGLTLGKKFITQAACVPKQAQTHILKSFPALSSPSPFSSPSPLYPCYFVDLVTVDQQWVTDALVESQLVWPSHASFPKGVEPIWTCVGVMSVEDAGHVWCQFCLDKPKPRLDAMTNVLRETAPPTDDDDEQSNPHIPEVGELCIAYFDPKYCHTPSCIAAPVWGRGRLLWVEPGAKLRLLSIDYGVTATLPLSHILPLPPECMGIPPLAIPCKLVGVAPIPVCTVVQENAAGILRNLAFEKAAYRKEIIAFGGVEALLKLAQSCDVGVVEQATAALLNMAISDEEKTEMGRRGAVETLLALVLAHSSHPSLSPLSLGALYTLTIHNPHNQHRLLTQRAVGKLSALLTGDAVQGREKKTLTALLRSLGAFAPSHSSNQKRGSASDKKIPVYRCLGDQEVCEDVRGEGGEEGEVSGGVTTVHSYIYNSIFPVREDSMHAFKDVESVKEITRGMLQRSICAMINTGQMCTIYVGVASNGRVRGVQIDRKEQDRLAGFIDGLMHCNISPAIKHNRYRVMFVPVVSGSHSTCVPAETYVLQLEIRASGQSRREVYTIIRERDGEKTEQCYCRHGKTNVQMSPQELRNLLAMQESSCHGNEISSLLQNISSLRATLEHITTAMNSDSATTSS